MLNPQYRWLNNDDYEIVKETCLQKVFTDFGKTSSRGREGAFDRMLLMRRVCFDFSVGAFLDNQMIGYVLMGTGFFQKAMSIYDCGGGTIPEYRKQGILSGIFHFFIKNLPNKSTIKQAFVAVKPRTQKESAGRICEKAGYIYQRDLYSYKLLSKSAFTNISHTNQFDIRSTTKPNWSLYQQWQQTFPGWERTRDVIILNTSYEIYLEAYQNNTLVGFLIGDSRYGKISQMGVRPGSKTTPVFLELIQNFYQVSKNKHLRMFHLDSQEKYVIDAFEQLGFVKISELEELKYFF